MILLDKLCINQLQRPKKKWIEVIIGYVCGIEMIPDDRYEKNKNKVTMKKFMRFNNLSAISLSEIIVKET